MINDKTVYANVKLDSGKWLSVGHLLSDGTQIISAIVDDGEHLSVLVWDPSISQGKFLGPKMNFV